MTTARGAAILPTMAYYPAKPGAWVFKTYGGYGNAWDEAKAQARRTLYGWAVAGEARTYTELVQTVTAIPWPEGAYTHSGQQVGRLLGQVSIEELSPLEDRPLLSSLVINLEANASIGGFEPSEHPARIARRVVLGALCADPWISPELERMVARMVARACVLVGTPDGR